MIVFIIAKPLPDLVISKSDNPDPVSVGGILTYTVNVKNIGNAVARDVKIVDAIPSEVTFIPSTAGCALDNNPLGPVTCSLGDIGTGQEKSVDIQVTVNSGGLNCMIVNTVTAIDGSDANTSDNVVSELTKVTQPCTIFTPITIPLPIPCEETDTCIPADFGDAPDGEPTTYPSPGEPMGSFPSYLINNGARAVGDPPGQSTVWLSTTNYNFNVSHEMDYVDPFDPDGMTNLVTDLDDGVDYDWLGSVNTDNSFSGDLNLTFWIDTDTAPAASLNVFIDRTVNGEWDIQEWIVKNEPYTLNGAPLKVEKTFAFNVPADEHCYWLRAIVSTESAISTDGSGIVKNGEVEDWLIVAPSKTCTGAGYGETGGFPPIGLVPPASP